MTFVSLFHGIADLCCFQLKPHVMVLLVEALNNEAYPTNVRLLLPLCYAYSCEDILYSSDFAKLAITTIGSLICKYHVLMVC